MIFALKLRMDAGIHAILIPTVSTMIAAGIDIFVDNVCSRNDIIPEG